jgi:hypothetical protein
MRTIVFVMTCMMLAACWRDPPPTAPEECKITTDPEACRKYYEQRRR